MTGAGLVARACPICGEGAPSRLFAESTIDLEALDGFAFASRKLPEYMHPRLVECERCGLLYANPVFPLDMLLQAYETAAFDSSGEAHCASLTYARHIRKLLPRLGRSGALDVGAGDGAFLERLIELGFDQVRGIEPSAAPRATAKDHIKPLLLPGLFAPGRFQSTSFSLVTCFQTIEHMFDPLETARTAFDLLRPGGAFVLIAHNRRALSARLLGRKSPIFDVEHLQLFCPRTVRQLLAKAGFGGVSVAPIWNSYPIHYWLKLLPLPSAIKRALFRFATNSAAGNAILPLPAGNLIAIGLK